MNLSRKEAAAEALVQLLCGSIGGAISSFISYPLVVIRLKSILSDHNNKKDKGKNETQLESTLLQRVFNTFNPYNYKSFHIILSIINHEGLLGLYKGVFTSVICSIIQNGCQFFFAKIFQYVFNFSSDKISSIIIVNLYAAVLTALFINPIEVLNTRIATHHKKSIGNIELINDIISNEGLRSFYKGLLPSLILTTYPVINLTIYGYLKGKIERFDTPLTGKEIVLISFISKFLTTIINYPLLLIKSLFQSNHTKETLSLVKIIEKIYNTKGILGFYNGFFNKMASSQFNSVLLMLIYEKIQEYARFIVFVLLFGFKVDLKKKN